MCITRSGLKLAPIAASGANGHTVLSLQGWKALSAFFMRQPVSASTSTRCGSALGSGNARLPTAACFALAGRVVSQVDTGNAEGLESTGSLAVVRSAMVPAPMRSVMRIALPSTVNGGHTALASAVVAAAGAV